MFALLRSATTPRGVRILVNAALIGVIVWAAFMTFGLARAWSVAGDLRTERLASCERGNVVRGEIAQVSGTLRHVVLLAVQNSRPVSEMTFRQRLLYEGFKDEASRLKVAIARLHPVPCEED